MRRIVLPLLTVMLLCAAVSLHAQGTLPVGASIPVTLNETVSSKDATVGQKVDGQVTSDVTVNGRVIIPRGSRVNLSVASVASAGRLKGQSKLWLKIDSIIARGRTYTPACNWQGKVGSSRGKRTAVGAGGGAAAGAVIGAIAGGGKGAAIGAAVGAGAGTAGAAATGEVEVEMPAESKWNFRLKTALTVQ
jgi:hypothetical protein